jgi:hypothetical protein
LLALRGLALRSDAYNAERLRAAHTLLHERARHREQTVKGGDERNELVSFQPGA